MKILLVDDSGTMRSIEKSALAGLGVVEFTEAADGVEALAAMAGPSAPFDLVLVDWNMPRLSGGELVVQVRRTDKKTPLVMVTTEAEKSRVIEVLKAGVNGYVIKPFTTEVLLERVKLALEKARKAA